MIHSEYKCFVTKDLNIIRVDTSRWREFDQTLSARESLARKILRLQYPHAQAQAQPSYVTS